MSFSIELLDKRLKHPKISVKKEASNEEIFERIRKFKIEKNEYKIIWYSNIRYLHYNNITIPFHSVKQSNTWPHASKMNLQFYYYENICCVLKIEDY